MLVAKKVGSTVIAKKGGTVVPTSIVLAGGTIYTGSTTWGSGSLLAYNTYTTYIGNDTINTNTTITGLAATSRYAFKVCAHQGDGNLRSFNNTNAASNSNNRSEVTLKGAFDAEELPLTGENILSSSFVSPNPARDNMTLTIDLSQSANLNIIIFTADGKQVLVPVDAIDYRAGRYTFNIPLKGLAAGVYSIVINADNEVIIDNVVVMP